MNHVTCPRCGAEVASADVNVAEGVMFCRACGTVTRLSEAAVDPQIAAVDVAAAPPRGCSVVTFGPDTIITASARSCGLAAGALALALFWNGIVSVFVLSNLASTLTYFFGRVPAWFPAPPMNGNGGANMTSGMILFMWIFLTPFIAIGAAMIAAVAFGLMGRVEVRLGAEQGIVFTGCGPLGIQSRFDPAAVRSVSLGQTSPTHNNASKPAIIIAAERDVRFGSMLPDARRLWLAAILKSVLAPA